MEVNEIIKPENLVYEKPRLMNENPMHYCPGCSHGVIHKLIAEVIAEMGMEDKTIGISPVGCAVFAYNYLDIDWIEAAHGRAPAIATAVKRLNPGKMVFTYQGGQSWRKHRDRICQQCHLWYDRWSDGSHHTGRNADGNLPIRPKHRPKRLSVKDRRLACTIGRNLLSHPSERTYCRSCPQSQKDASQGIRKFDGRQRHFNCRIRFHLFIWLENDT